MTLVSVSISYFFANDLVAQLVQKERARVIVTTDGEADDRMRHYQEAGTYLMGRLPGSDTARTVIEVPENASAGDQIHMICEVTDAGSPPLTRYQRVVIDVVDSRPADGGR